MKKNFENNREMINEFINLMDEEQMERGLVNLHESTFHYDVKGNRKAVHPCRSLIAYEHIVTTTFNFDGDYPEREIHFVHGGHHDSITLVFKRELTKADLCAINNLDAVKTCVQMPNGSWCIGYRVTKYVWQFATEAYKAYRRNERIAL